MQRITLMLVMLLLSFSAPLMAGNIEKPIDYNEKMYNSYVSGSIGNWSSIIKQMEEDYRLTQDPELLKQIIFANYGFIGYMIGVDDDKTAQSYINATEKYLDRIMDDEDVQTFAWHYSMYSAIQGFKLNFSPLKAPFIGPSVMNYIEKAVETDSLEPMGWIELGNSYFYRPALFGGSAEKALFYYQRASKLFYSDNQLINQSWVFLNLQVQLAQCYIRLERYDEAMETYSSILSIEPEFSWVKDELLPELEMIVKGLTLR